MFEAREGGHIYHRGADGSECRWAQVLAFEPPDRLVDQLGHQSAVAGRNRPERTSDVEIRFIAEAGDRTRLELEHRNLDRHGEGWESTRDSFAAEGGWALYLKRYADVVADRAAPARSTSRDLNPACRTSRRP